MRNTVAFIVPCRDKEPYVAECVESVLNQTYDAMTVVLSDQGSTDGSFDAMKEVADRYDGPNTVRLLRCPETDYHNMAGYNAHLNWLMNELEEDFIIQTSADDVPHPERAERVVETWQQYDCSYVGTQQFAVAENDRDEIVNAPLKDEQSMFVTLPATVKHRFGGKTSSAWTRELFQKYGPLQGVDCQDLIVPFWAGLEHGFYFIAEWLHTMIHRPDQNNLGLEGRLRVAETSEEQLQITELIHFQMCSNQRRMLALLEYFQKHEPHRITDEVKHTYQIICDSMIAQAVQWSLTRETQTMHRIDPTPFPT